MLNSRTAAATAAAFLGFSVLSLLALPWTPAGAGFQAGSNEIAFEVLAPRPEVPQGEVLEVDALIRNAGKEPVNVIRDLLPEGVTVRFTVEDSSGRVVYESPVVKQERLAGSWKPITLARDEFWGSRFRLGSARGNAAQPFPPGEYHVRGVYQVPGKSTSYLTGLWESRPVRLIVIPKQESSK